MNERDRFENVRKVIPLREREGETFEAGDVVKVPRDNGRWVEDGWKIIGFHNITGERTAILRRIELDNGEILEKDVSVKKLAELNK